MKEIIKFIGSFVKRETRWAWMIFGLVVGLSSCNWYNAAHSGVIMSILYVVYFRVEYKKDHSWITTGLVLLCSFAGFGIIKLLTQK